VDAEVNKWVGSGPVAKDIKTGRIGNGQMACSFQLSAPTRDGNRTVWVRINVYDPSLIRYVRRKVKPGVIARVTGELMNRKHRGSGPQLTEVRAQEIDIE
jgi:single-stranded DNA-binding protein